MLGSNRQQQMLRPNLHSAGIVSGASHSHFLRIGCTCSDYPSVRASRGRSTPGFRSTLQALQEFEWRGYNLVSARTGSILRIAFLGLQNRSHEQHSQIRVQASYFPNSPHCIPQGDAGVQCHLVCIQPTWNVEWPRAAPFNIPCHVIVLDRQLFLSSSSLHLFIIFLIHEPPIESLLSFSMLSISHSL